MNKLESIILVDYFLYHADTIAVADATGFLGPNGTGKSAILDAVQIALLGADRRHLQFNAKKQSKGEQKRTLQGYCFGETDSDGNARDVANTYITLTFRNDKTGKPISIGIAMHAEKGVLADPVVGLYVLNGAALTLNDHLEDLGDGDMGSLPWDDFRVRLEKHRSTDCIITATDRNEQFVRAALHALQAGHRPIDMVEYVKALRQSLTLSSDKSTSDFVRDVLVGEEKVNRSKARDLIVAFRQLKDFIKTIENKINDLEAVAKLYRLADRSYGLAATLRGLAATYGFELVVQQHDLVKEVHECAIERYEASQKASEQRHREKEAAESRRDKADRLLNANTIEAEFRAREAELKMHRAQLTNAVQPVEYAVHSLRKSVVGLMKLPCMEPLGDRLTDVLTQLQTESTDQLLDEHAANLFHSAHELLRDATPILECELQAISERHRNAESEHEAQLGIAQSMRSGGKIVPRAVGATIGFLSTRGITAEPVCNLVKVKDPDWQPAIEAFLKTNRFALVVREDSEKALEVLRRNGRHLNFTKVVQPLQDGYSWDEYDERLVGNLLEGDPWAVAALRLKLGKMLKVYTERDLLTYTRALSQDAWCSTGGMVERLREPEEGLFLGGATQSAPTANQDRKRYAAQAELEVAAKLKSELQAITTQVKSVQTDYSVAVIEPLLRKVETERVTVAATKIALDAIDLSAVEELRREASQAKIELGAAEKALLEAEAAKVSRSHEVTSAKKKLDQAEADIRKAKFEEEEARKNPGFDSSAADARRLQQYQQTQMKYGGADSGFDEMRMMEIWISECRREADSAHTRGTRQESDGNMAFNSYIGNWGDSFHENRSDFRHNLKQIEAEKKRLEDSELQSKSKEADEALKAAEDAFRKDIALKVRDAIERMESTRIEMNRILALCPPFSNNERYRFFYEVVPQYLKIHQYIMESRNEEGPGLFANGDPEVTQAVLKMLEEAADPSTEKVTNPLDDFRLLFNFDLHVYRDDKKVGSLGKRMGTGSNGEHLTPFYVVTGATLAHAYRLDNRESKEGFGIMIIDEAFAAMDEQNSLAAAQFLRSLGLQLIMAGPNDSLSKIMPFTNYYYEMFRGGLALDYQRNLLKDAANDLMKSDMPSVHPGLIAQQVELLRANADARDDS